MSRDIMFRGKRIDNNEWAYGFWGNRPDGANFVCPFENYDAYAVYPETVGQYTGLKDKKNTPIYEGDIDLISGGTVEFNVDTCCYILRRANTTFIRLNVRKNNIEIIGNIYENT